MSAMSSEQQDLQFRRNNFYRDAYRITLAWIVFMAILAVVLTLALAYQNIMRKVPAYYATTTSGLTIPLQPLSEPVITNHYILQWASLATRTALNLDFAHYESQLKAARPYFTADGWSSFNNALKAAGLLQTVTGQKVVMSVIVSGAAVILNRAVFHGRFMWRIQMPILVTFESASQKSQLDLIVTMTVERVPVLDAAKGIQITNFSATRKVA